MEQTMNQNKMGTRPIPGLLVSMSLPPMISMLIQSLYNIVDSMFVARYSEDAFTAVSLAFPLQNFILAVAVGTGVGLNSYIARKLGEGRREDANNAVVHGLLLSLVSGLLFVALGAAVIPPFFSLFTEESAVLDYAYSYSYIVVFFAFGQQVHIAVEKVFQATGKMLFPMVFQAVGAILNIILDPIMIFGLFGFPAMGVAGAAAATVIGQMVAMLLSLLALFCFKQEVKADFRRFHLDLRMVKDIYVVGLPSMLMNSLGSVLVMGLNAILVRFSNEAVSAFGLYFKLQTFVYMPVSGLIQGTMPIMGFNYGARQRERLMQAFRLALGITAAIMLLGNLLFLLWPDGLLYLFNAEGKLLELGRDALRIISCGFLPASLGFIIATLFQAMGRGASSLVIFLLRQFAITLPAAFLLAIPLGLTGVWLAFPLAECIAAAVSLVLYSVVRRRDPVLSGAGSELQEAAR